MRKQMTNMRRTLQIYALEQSGGRNFGTSVNPGVTERSPVKMVCWALNTQLDQGEAKSGKGEVCVPVWTMPRQLL